VPEPEIKPDELRKELFKFYYATQNPEKFDLYQKADAAEFLQAVLELVHFCLNPNNAKKDIDDYCGVIEDYGPPPKVKPRSQCIIHSKVNMTVIQQKWC
jgi:hypothetical protein